MRRILETRNNEELRMLKKIGIATVSSPVWLQFADVDDVISHSI